MKRRGSDWMALGLFCAAALALLITHALPISFLLEPEGLVPFYGYQVWPGMWADLMGFQNAEPLDLMIWVGILLGVSLIVVSPFIITVVAGNRHLWWFLVVCSVLVLVSLTGMLGWFLVEGEADSEYWRRGIGYWCLMAFPVLHFAGVLCIRRMEFLPGLAPGQEDR